jgi:hypothetical protein
MSCAGCLEEKPLVDFRPCGHFYCAQCATEIPNERDRGCQIPLNISLEQAYEMVAVYEKMAIKEEIYGMRKIEEWYRKCVDSLDVYHHKTEEKLARYQAEKENHIAVLVKRLTELSHATKRAEAVIQAHEALNGYNERSVKKVTINALSGDPIKVYFASRLTRSDKHFNTNQEKKTFSQRFRNGEISVYRPGKTVRDGYKTVPFIAWMFNQDRIHLGTVPVPNVRDNREEFRLLGTRDDLVFLDVKDAGIWEMSLKGAKPRRCKEPPLFDQIPKIRSLDSATVLLPDNIIVVLDVPEMRLAVDNVCPYAPGGVYHLIVKLPYYGGGRCPYSGYRPMVDKFLEIPVDILQ